MRPKKVPLRMCAGCGEMKPKKDLIRVVKAPAKAAAAEENETAIPEISIDLTGKKPGRGAYLCRDLECLKKARKSRRFEKAFACKIPDVVYDKMEGELAGEDGNN